MGQQVDRFPAIPDGADNVLVNDSDFHRCCYIHVRRRARRALYQNEASFLTFLLTCTLPYEKLYDNYVELFAYLEKEGYKIVGAPRAVYIDGIWNQEDPAKWLTIIQVPVEKV